MCDLSPWGVCDKPSTGHQSYASASLSSQNQLFITKITQSIASTLPTQTLDWCLLFVWERCLTNQAITRPQGQCDGLISCFSNLKGHVNHLRDLVKKQILIQEVWEAWEARDQALLTISEDKVHTAGQQPQAVSSADECKMLPGKARAWIFERSPSWVKPKKKKTIIFPCLHMAWKTGEFSEIPTDYLAFKFYTTISSRVGRGYFSIHNIKGISAKTELCALLISSTKE